MPSCHFAVASLPLLVLLASPALAQMQATVATDGRGHKDCSAPTPASPPRLAAATA